MKSVAHIIRFDLDDLLSARVVASSIGILAAVSSVAMAVATGDLWRKYTEERNKFSLSSSLGTEETTTERGAVSRKTPAEEVSVIVARNLFGSKAPTQAAPTAANAQQLKMRLVGTNIGSKGDPFAIIEDLTKNEQDVFVVKDSVFGRAKLLDIARDKIKIEINGKTEVLALDDGTTGSGTPNSDIGGGSTGDEQSEFTVPEQELADALGNLPVLLSQARAVPYFRNGQSIGMRLFAIRRDSMYEKLGLKNGDILLAVNDASLSDPSQALKIFEQLKNERSIRVKLERNGESKDLSYAIR